MSAQPVERDGPLFPMPPVSEAALRVAVKRLDLVAAVRFEQEFRAAWEAAVQTDSTVPLHTFLHQWALFVSLHRYPARSARLAELERAFSAAQTLEEARQAAAEIGRLQDLAAGDIAG